LTYTYERRIGEGVTLSWDVSGGTTWTNIGTLVDTDKMEASWKTVNASLQGEVADRPLKTSYSPGKLKYNIIYDPLNTEYIALKASFVSNNVPIPNWKVTFPDTLGGAGSGSTTDSFFGSLTGLSREFKKDSFLTCELEITVYGDI
jgi:hypothetical protein